MLPVFEGGCPSCATSGGEVEAGDPAPWAAESIGDPSAQSIDVTFDKFEPHARGGVRGAKCVVPSQYTRIAWGASLAYSVKGPIPKTRARRGQLYVKVIQDRVNRLTLHNGTKTRNSFRVIEYFPADEDGMCEPFDDHVVSDDWEPRPGSGVCAIRSEIELELSLWVLPQGNGEPFGTPKYDPDTGKDLPNQGEGSRGSWSTTSAMTVEEWQPIGWKGKKWKARYDIGPNHCMGYPTLEPDPPTLPRIRSRLLAGLRLDSADGGRAVATLDTRAEPPSPVRFMSERTAQIRVHLGATGPMAASSGAEFRAIRAPSALAPPEAEVRRDREPGA
jgi:hypothetical protein